MKSSKDLELERIKEIRVGVLGASNVGKTSIITRFAQNRFFDEPDPTLMDHYKTPVENIANGKVYLDIMDVGGAEEHGDFQTECIEKSRIFIFVFAVDNPASFERIRQFKSRVDEIRKEVDLMFLVGNKNDVEKRRISTGQGEHLAAELNIKYFETSARTGYNCKALFRDLAEDVMLRDLQMENDRHKVCSTCNVF